MKPLPILLALLLAGCAEMPAGVESDREAVLEYLGSSAGTAGPFSKKSFRDLEALAPKDRGEASALFERGAVAFEIFQPDQPMRIVLVLHHKVVGDFRTVGKGPT